MTDRNDKTLVLATAYTPELRRPELRPSAFPRTDYVELSRLVNCDILDFSLYDELGLRYCLRPCEKKLRLDFYLALVGYRRSRSYSTVLLMSERVAIPYLMLCKLFGKRTRSVMISNHSSRKQARVFRALGLSRMLDVVVSYTPAQQGFITDELGLTPDAIAYVPYSVDTEFFSPGDFSKGRYVMSAGGVPGRDYGTLLKAVSEINCEVRIVCGGRAYGRNTSGGLTVNNDRVRVISRIPLTSMRDLYRDASLVVIPLTRNRDDAAGVTVLLEAMSMAKCVIVSSSPGIMPYIENEDAAVVVPPERYDLLRDAIGRLLSSEDERTSRGVRGRALARNNYDVSCCVARLARVLCGEVVQWPARPNEPAEGSARGTGFVSDCSEGAK